MLGLVAGLSVLAGALHLWTEHRLAARFTVIDGDSLQHEGESLRLEGIDAPELAQTCERERRTWPCGRQAREALARLVAAGPIECRWRRRDRYNRPLARCAAAGADLGRQMVEAGLAVAYGGYEAEAAAARAAGRGIWAGTFEQPQEWRARHQPRAPGS